MVVKIRPTMDIVTALTQKKYVFTALNWGSGATPRRRKAQDKGTASKACKHRKMRFEPFGSVPHVRAPRQQVRYSKGFK